MLTLYNSKYTSITSPIPILSLFTMEETMVPYPTHPLLSTKKQTVSHSLRTYCHKIVSFLIPVLNFLWGDKCGKRDTHTYPQPKKKHTLTEAYFFPNNQTNHSNILKPLEGLDNYNNTDLHEETGGTILWTDEIKS